MNFSCHALDEWSRDRQLTQAWEWLGGRQAGALGSRWEVKGWGWSREVSGGTGTEWPGLPRPLRAQVWAPFTLGSCTPRPAPFEGSV